MWESRVAPLSGVLFALLLVAGFIVNPDTEFMPPEDQVVAQLQDGPVRVMASNYLILLAAGALLWFSASVYQAMRGRDDSDTRLPMVALSGGVFAAALIGVSAVATFAAAERVWTMGVIEPGAAAALLDVSGIAIGNAAPVGLAVLVGAWGTAAIRTSGASRAGWVSVLIALGLASPFGWAVLVLGVAWVPTVGISMYRSEPEKVRVPAG